MCIYFKLKVLYNEKKTYIKTSEKVLGKKLKLIMWVSFFSYSPSYSVAICAIFAKTKFEILQIYVEIS